MIVGRTCKSLRARERICVTTGLKFLTVITKGKRRCYVSLYVTQLCISGFVHQNYPIRLRCPRPAKYHTIAVVMMDQWFLLDLLFVISTTFQYLSFFSYVLPPSDENIFHWMLYYYGWAHIFRRVKTRKGRILRNLWYLCTCSTLLKSAQELISVDTNYCIP